MKKISYLVLAVTVIIAASWGLSNVMLNWLSSVESSESEEVEDVEEGSQTVMAEEEEQEEDSKKKSRKMYEGPDISDFTREEIFDWRHSPLGGNGPIELWFNEVEYDLGIDGNTSDEELLDVIHQMSHQKIRSGQKVGHIPLTRDTVDQLYEAVHEKEDSKHEGLFRDIAEQWNKEKWLYIHHEHNAVWSIQGDGIGKATGKLTPDEEMRYIEEHYPELLEELKNK